MERETIKLIKRILANEIVEVPPNTDIDIYVKSIVGGYVAELLMEQEGVVKK